MREIKEIIVHCSATAEGADIKAADIRRYHVEHNGWTDIGYHYVIDLDGTIEKGRSEDVVGAHCKGHNSISIGVCYIGGLDADGNPKDTRTQSQKTSLKALLRRLKEDYPQATIHGHREFACKACPCFDAKEEYKAISNKYL